MADDSSPLGTSSIHNFCQSSDLRSVISNSERCQTHCTEDVLFREFCLVFSADLVYLLPPTEMEGGSLNRHSFPKRSILNQRSFQSVSPLISSQTTIRIFTSTGP
ncbi:hypothetical protein NPIL_647181 [Nephila pilipes]|uniref:Uncharacterized protein n=1 Tax=Nephila pilipes TaxID=299642 RepID=A0A8X6MBL6_NEPPI|nr:hypothetical protein NPIL_647181 [Nephila pilipes]